MQASEMQQNAEEQPSPKEPSISDQPAVIRAADTPVGSLPALDEAAEAEDVNVKPTPEPHDGHDAAANGGSRCQISCHVRLHPWPAWASVFQASSSSHVLTTIADAPILCPMMSHPVGQASYLICAQDRCQLLPQQSQRRQAHLPRRPQGGGPRWMLMWRADRQWCSLCR